MLLGAVVTDRLGKQREVEVLNQIQEGLFWLGSEDSHAGVVLVGVDRMGELDLDGSHRMVFWDLPEVDFQIDEAIIASLEGIFDVSGLFDKDFELFEGVADEMFV